MAKRYRMIDATTQVASKNILEELDPKVQYNWVDGSFGFVGIIYISKLARMKMPNDALRLALLLMEHATFNDGVSIKPHKDYAAILNISRSRVSEYLSLLSRLDIVARMGGRFVMLNPQLFWRGNATEQRNAIKRWHALRQPQIIYPKAS